MLISGLFLLCSILESPGWVYFLCATIGGGSFLAQHIWDYSILRKKHRKLVEHGLKITYHTRELREELSNGGLDTLFNDRLSSSEWRQDILEMFGRSKWLGVTDHFTTPHTFRWEMHFAAPRHWNEDDRLCLYVSFIACLPSNLDYVFDINENILVIKNQAEYTDNVPSSHFEAPPESIPFWSHFQQYLGFLLAENVPFNPPVFETGLTEEIDIHVPATFRLAEGGQLKIDLNDGVYNVSLYSNEGEPGPVITYTSANAFWWVWRNAVEMHVVG